MTGSLAAAVGKAWRNPQGRTGIVILGLLLMFAVFGPLLLPDPAALGLDAISAAPGAGHPFGTDRLGRDILARVATGARISLSIAAIAVALSLTIGTAVGMIAATGGPAIDRLLMRFVDAALAVPRLFVLLLLLAVWERIPVGALILVIGATGWLGTSRLVRGEALRLREEGYLQAARALGGGRSRAIFRHLLPNVAGVVLVSATLAIGDVILLEAGLSYLGIGVQPPTPSWGAMVLAGKDSMTTAWWEMFFPGVAVVITVLAIGLVSDALRAAFDPRSA
ncbi:MAG: ABC transporter permease [Gemmatimonadales bacterium]